MSYAIHTLRVVFYDISFLKYIHFFNLLTKTKNEELEHNLPSHPMPHPPQPQSSTDFAKPEPSSKIGTVMKIRQWNQHSSSHTGTSKKVATCDITSRCSSKQPMVLCIGREFLHRCIECALFSTISVPGEEPKCLWRLPMDILTITMLAMCPKSRRATYFKPNVET